MPTSEAEILDVLHQIEPLIRKLTHFYTTQPEMRYELQAEAHFRALELIADFQPGRGIPLIPYLIRSLEFALYSLARSQWRQTRRIQPIEDLESVSQEPRPAELWNHRLHVEQIKPELIEAMGRLTERQRNAVLWRYYEECDYPEIARWMEVTKATARSTVRHGIARLRAKLQRDPFALEELPGVPKK